MGLFRLGRRDLPGIKSTSPAMGGHSATSNHETHFYNMGHEIICGVLTDFSAWLQRVLPRAE